MLAKEDLFAIAAVMKPLDEDIAKIEKLVAEMKRQTTGPEAAIESQVDSAVKLLEEGRENLRQMIEELLSTKEQQEKNKAPVFTPEETI